MTGPQAMMMKPRHPTLLLAGLMAATLAACGGGGGGGASVPPPPPPPKGPLTVTTEPVLAGNNAVFRITLAAGAVGPADVVYSTSSGSNTGDATSSAGCLNAGTDYHQAVNATVSVPSGANSTTLNIITCSNTSFEPNEVFELVTSFEGAATRTKGLIINNAAGGLNDTGITQCLNAAGALGACTGSDIPGQDGQLGRDLSTLTNAAADGRVGFSFATSGTDCVEDKVTGLIWDSTSSSVSSLAGAQALVAAANGAARCGRTDWRLPAVDELMSLVDAGVSSGARIDTRFAGTQAVPAWSATNYAGDTRAAWVVDFGSGAVAFETATNPLAKPFAGRLVAGTAPTTTDCDAATTARYTDHGNGTVTDRQTGLVWQQCVDGLSGAACSTGTATTHASFAAAHSRAAAVNADATGAGKGFGDWRVPNRNELASLVNWRCNAPAIQRSRFPGTPSASAWTSSPLASGVVWYVDFTDGNVGVSGSSGNRVLRLVRAGQ